VTGPEFFTLREQALGKWVHGLVEREFPDSDRVQIVAICTAAMVLAVADETGLPETDKKEVERFGIKIRRGCEARGGTRKEAATAALAVALAKVKAIE
jgi:hypothetical protein